MFCFVFGSYHACIRSSYENELSNQEAYNKIGVNNDADFLVQSSNVDKMILEKKEKIQF